jgi:hypothetical protein
VFVVPSVAEWVSTAPAISYIRHLVTREKKAGFIEEFNEVRGLLEDFTKPYGVVGGWRIEKEDEKREEWVLFFRF